MKGMSWTLGIGDPSLMAWVTVFAYLICALCALNLFRSAKVRFGTHQKQQSAFWLMMFVVMMALGINKQLDLQTLFTDLGRYFAREQGWYGHRGAVQKVFILGVMCVGVLLLGSLCWFYRSVLKTNVLAILGLTVLFIFVLVRASSFHAMDRFINLQFLGLKTNWILELGGIGLVLINQALISKAARPNKRAELS